MKVQREEQRSSALAIQPSGKIWSINQLHSVRKRRFFLKRKDHEPRLGLTFSKILKIVLFPNVPGSNKASIKKGLKRLWQRITGFPSHHITTRGEVKSFPTILAEAAGPERMIPVLKEPFIVKNAADTII